MSKRMIEIPKNSPDLLKELTFREKLVLGLAALAGLGALALGMTKPAQEYVGVNNTDCFGSASMQTGVGTPVSAVAPREAARLGVPESDMTLVLIYKNGEWIAEGPNGEPVFTQESALTAENCS